ncbi:MAG: hypothetical protein U5L02_01295 [Rheinheimera sp.]|nr:hypothetical protein [Rheinheimera sp.]
MFKSISLLRLSVGLLLSHSALAADHAPLPQTEFNSAFGRYFAEVASDELQGRAPATVGEERTVAYIEQQFQRLGLQPFAKNSYRQAVPVVQIDPVAVSALSLSGDKLPKSLGYKTQMMAWSTRMQPQVEVKNSELVFVGYGIVAPEYGWNDYKNVDVKGKTVERVDVSELFLQPFGRFLCKAV